MQNDCPNFRVAMRSHTLTYNCVFVKANESDRVGQWQRGGSLSGVVVFDVAVSPRRYWSFRGIASRTVRANEAHQRAVFSLGAGVVILCQPRKSLSVCREPYFAKLPPLQPQFALVRARFRIRAMSWSAR